MSGTESEDEDEDERGGRKRNEDELMGEIRENQSTSSSISSH